MKNLIRYYNTYKEPEFLRKGFNTEFEFIVWLRQHELSYLKYILECFENCELYEYCPPIAQVIKEKSK